MTRRDAVNAEAVRRICAADPVWTGVALAGEVLPELEGQVLAHAGPPVAWERMSTPQRGAAVASVLFEGWAASVDAAVELLGTGAVRFVPNHDLGAVNPMAGLMSPSSAVFVVQERGTGVTAVTTLVEGANPCHRFGYFAPDGVERLRWLRDSLAPVLREVVERSGGIPLRPIVVDAVAMGDELHQRNTASTSLFVRAIIEHLLAVPMPDDLRAQIGAYYGPANVQYFLNLGMAMCKAAMRTVEGIPGCSVVTAIARNGTDVGIQVSGLPGRWFTGPAGAIDGRYFGSFGPGDACPDLGDSAITETYGVGYNALPAAPAAFPLIGLSGWDEAVARVDRMRRICAGVNPSFDHPALAAPFPCGFDVHRVAASGITPGIATAIAHNAFGDGRMIGVGMVETPLAPFVAASRALQAAAVGVS